MNESRPRPRLAVVLAGAASFFSLYAPQALMPLLHDWLGASAALAGAIVSAGTFGVALAAPFAGLLADRFGRRRVIVIAAHAVVLPSFAVALAQGPLQLMAARFAQGLLLPGIFAVTVAYIGGGWPADRARQVTALYVAGTIGGGFSGRFLSGLVAEFGGWRLGLGVLAVGQLLLALAIRHWLPEERDRARPKTAVLATMRMLLARADLRGAYLVGFTLLFALMAGFTYITLRLSLPPFALGPAALSAIFVVYLLSLVTTPLAGRLLNRWGHARVLMLGWIVAVGGLALSLGPSLGAVVGALALFSCGLFVAQTAATSFVAEASGAARATSVGFYVTAYYLGGTAGGVLPAPMWDAFGWSGVALLIVAVGALSVMVARRHFHLAAIASPPPLSGAAGES